MDVLTFAKRYERFQVNYIINAGNDEVSQTKLVPEFQGRYQMSGKFSAVLVLKFRGTIKFCSVFHGWQSTLFF